MGPVPDGWAHGERVGEWVRTSAGAPVTLRLVSPAGHAPEWQVRAGGKLVSQVSDRAAALALGNEAASGGVPSPAGWSGGNLSEGGAQRAAEVAPAPPTVDPWKAFGLAAAELLRPLGGDPLHALELALRMATSAGTQGAQLSSWRNRCAELSAELDRLKASVPHLDALSSASREVWHRVSSPQGNCAVLELRTEGGRILSRRQVVESDRRDIQLAKVDDLMARGAKESA